MRPLSIQGITAGYGEIHPRKCLFRITPVQIYALLGPNGGGKSTTLKSVPDS